MAARTVGGAENAVLTALDRAVKRRSVLEAIDALVDRLQRKLAAQPRAKMVWDTLPMALFDPAPPGDVRSAWVFVLRAGTATGAERHPNSRQRTMSYRGAGDLQVRLGGRWRSHALAGNRDAPLGRRWVSIPENTWHQVVVGDRNWAVVSFHTVEADQLIEERPHPTDPGSSLRRRYLGEASADRVERST
ncbi:MAG: hypothetical protein AUI47_10170 [Acidobacteria bacterium 13_1_40CM_2_68_5]|nr:MAG: hypothetical protein AUI47_10170 [Acidobacteria bacterium 13_1_40CM_2_68_5]OLE66594.1 MAG: hypothetical protein AUG09_06640 [Acidobacteria bacterium 13_1_20CM_2_68_7]